MKNGYKLAKEFALEQSMSPSTAARVAREQIKEFVEEVNDEIEQREKPDTEWPEITFTHTRCGMCKGKGEYTMRFDEEKKVIECPLCNGSTFMRVCL